MTFNNTNKSDFLKLVALSNDAKEDLINYAGTDFVSLRDSLITYIKAAYPLDYTYFVESDLGMMLIELVAYMGAVMSLKADMLANENFLLTARNRNSVRKLLQLIGVRLRGPLASAAEASYTVINYAGIAGVTIPIENRTITINSPEDGSQLSFTLYKVLSDGTIDLANSTGNISLANSEKSGGTGATAIWTNLVLQEGALVAESGQFAATESIKSINLSQFPIIDGSVQVYITDSKTGVNSAYKQVENVFFASGSSDKVFQVVYDDSYKATLIFGDGINGQNPGYNASYFVTYRVGGGSRGNIVSNFINAQVNATGSFTGFVTNTTQSTGGADAETVSHAKKYAPLTFSRQDRVVTLEDYTSFANTFISSFGTVGKATAVARKAYCSGNIIDIYVVEKASDLQVQKATPTFKQQLITALQEKKMVTDEIVIVDGLVRTLDLEVLIQAERNLQTKESAIKAKVRDVILTFMNTDNREFGEPLVLADLNRLIYQIPEVRVSFIENLKDNVVVDFNELIQLNNLSIKVEYL